MENKLPDGWETPLLNEVITIKSGNSKLTKKNYVSKGKYTAFSGSGPDGKTDFYEHEGDAIILSAVGARCGKCFRASGKWTAIANTSIIRAKIENPDVYRYLFYMFNNENFWPRGGTGQPFVKSGVALKEMRIAFPPIPHQKLIVDKLDSLLAKVKDAQSRLDTIPVILNRFRQSVLAAAFSGELTKAWRKKNRCSKVDTLLKRNEYTIDNEAGLPELPETWVWGVLGNYADCSRGRFSIRPRNDPRYYDGKYPFIQIGDLPREGGYINKHSQTLNDLGLGVSKMFPKGTVAIAIVGATIANTGILGYDMCFPDSMVGIETGDEMRNRYCELFLRHKKYEIRQEAYSSGGQPNIKLQTLNPLPFAVAPAEEQVEIVKQVEYQLKAIDDFIQKYEHIKNYTDKLEQSILAKAFRGELVT